MRFWMTLLLIVSLLFSCSTKETPDWVAIYHEAFTEVMAMDEGLNGDMTYIAIDDTSMSLTDEDLQELMERMSAYGVEVIHASYESLKEDGKTDEWGGLSGILLSVDAAEVSDDIVFMVTKYRSGLGAIGVRCTFVPDKDGYKLKEAVMEWIS